MASSWARRHFCRLPDLAREATQIGWTAYDPRVWGTAVNAEAKLLLLGLAFHGHGFGWSAIQADASQRAPARPSAVLAQPSRASCVGIFRAPTQLA
jgi:hypothetical protein